MEDEHHSTLCKWCKSEIKPEAKVCRYCSRHQRWFWASVSIFAAIISAIVSISGAYFAAIQMDQSKSENIKAQEAVREVRRLKEEIKAINHGYEGIKTDLDGFNLEMAESAAKLDDLGMRNQEAAKNASKAMEDAAAANRNAVEAKKIIEDAGADIKKMNADIKRLKNKQEEVRKETASLLQRTDRSHARTEELNDTFNKQFSTLVKISAEISNQRIYNLISRTRRACDDDDSDCQMRLLELSGALNSYAETAAPILEGLKNQSFRLSEDAFASLDSPFILSQMGRRPEESMGMKLENVLAEVVSKLTKEERAELSVSEEMPPGAQEIFEKKKLLGRDKVNFIVMNKSYCFPFRTMYDSAFDGYIDLEKHNVSIKHVFKRSSGEEVEMKSKSQLFWDRYCTELAW